MLQCSHVKYPLPFFLTHPWCVSHSEEPGCGSRGTFDQVTERTWCSVSWAAGASQEGSFCFISVVLDQRKYKTFPCLCDLVLCWEIFLLAFVPTAAVPGSNQGNLVEASTSKGNVVLGSAVLPKYHLDLFSAPVLNAWGAKPCLSVEMTFPYVVNIHRHNCSPPFPCWQKASIKK